MLKASISGFGLLKFKPVVMFAFKNINIMTKFDNKFVPSTPKTFQVLELRDQQQEQQLVKKSPLSAAARNKVVNRSGSNYLSESKGYGPCSYSGCPWTASVPCRLDINIEGINRKWARKAGNGAWLPGHWEAGTFSSDQLSRWSLTLNDVDQSRRVLPLLSNDSVYTINFWGRHCAEDTEFCNASMDIIRKVINHHESGYDVNENIMLDSDISKWSRWSLKVVGSTAVGVVFGPGAGAGAYLASEASRVVGLETSASRFLGAIGSNVGEAALDFASGIAGEFGGSLPGLGFIGMTKDMLKHSEHCSEGRSYDPNCPMCKPW